MKYDDEANIRTLKKFAFSPETKAEMKFEFDAIVDSKV